MFFMLNLGTGVLLYLSGPHWTLRTIILGFYSLYSFILFTRQEGPDFMDAGEVRAPNVAGRTAKADPTMSGSPDPDKNRTPRLAGDSKLIVYCFLTKRRI